MKSRARQIVVGKSVARATSPLNDRQRQFASIIWRQGPIGRREIHQLTGVHPTLTGLAVAALIEAGLVRDGASPLTQDRGRPQIPVEIDPDRRLFLGLSISPGVIRLGRLDPTGAQRGTDIVRHVEPGPRLIPVAARMLADHLDERVYSIGISFTGVVDQARQAMLFSSSLPLAAPVSLAPLYEAAKRVPIVLNNDMHALALRWVLTSKSVVGDALLVGVDDGRLGASILIDGKPHRGSVSAASELGHMRLAVATQRCYCGHHGCLERIVSTGQLARFGAKTGRPLDAVMESPGADRHALRKALDHLATGLANAVNLIRPSKLVIMGSMVRHEASTRFLRDEVPPRVLPGLREQVELIFREHPNLQSTENAAWLALADVFGNALDTAAERP